MTRVVMAIALVCLGSTNARLSPQQAADDARIALVRAALNRSLEPLNYFMPCAPGGGLQGWRVTNQNRLIDDFEAIALLGPGFTTTHVIGGEVVTVMLTGKGADCTVRSNNSRNKGVGGGDLGFTGGGENLRLIMVAGQGGGGCRGRHIATPDPNANGGDGGAGGNVVVGWSRFSVVLAIGGRGGPGGGYGVKFHPGATPGVAGSGGHGGMVTAQWLECSVVGFIGGRGGVANASPHMTPPQDNIEAADSDPAALASSNGLKQGGPGGDVIMISPMDNSRRVSGILGPPLPIAFDVAGRGGDGGASRNNVGPGGTGGSVIRAFMGAQGLNVSPGAGGTGDPNGLPGIIVNLP